MKKILAKNISYAGVKRKKSDVKYIVIHYTGNQGDTAKGNATYFAKTNTRPAGAHFFVDKKGEIYKSINMNRIAYSVGGDMRCGDGGGKFFGVITNSNSVSIELCDCIKSPNSLQTEAVKKLIKHIKRHCKNAKTVVRHWDVNGKKCPEPFIGRDNSRWEAFKKYITSK